MTSRFEMTKAAHMKFPTSLLGDGDIQLWIDVVNGTTHEDYDEAHEETRVCLFGDHAAYWMAWRWHADNAGYVQENSIPLVRAQGLIKTLTSLGCQVNARWTPDGNARVTLSKDGETIGEEVNAEFENAVIVLAAKLYQKGTTII